MISRISSGIVGLLLKNNIIESDDIEVYQYGFEMILSTLVMLIIVLVCGLIFREIILSVVFFILFALVRSSSGGYHAETYFKCNTMYTINLVIVLLSSKFASPYYNISSHIVFLLIYLLTVYRFSPIENPNKPLNDSQKKRHKTLCIIYGLVLSALSFVLWFGINQIKYAVLITFTLLSVSFTMTVEIFKKGGESNEKSSS
jgi:accessory gene regulator B